jgi:O-antigen ligase
MNNKKLKYLFSIYLLFLPLENILEVTLNLEFGFKLYRIVGVALILLYIFKKKNNLSFKTNKIDISWFFVFVIGFSVSLLQAFFGNLNFKSFILEFIQILQLGFIYKISLFLVKKDTYSIFLKILLSGILINAFYLNVQQYLHEDSISRLTGFLDNSNICGFYLNIGVAILIFFIQQKKGISKYFFIFFLLLTINAIFQTGSRSNLVILAIILFVYLFLIIRNLIIGGLIAIILIIFFNYSQDYLLMSTTKSVTLTRLKHKSENEQFEELRIRVLRSSFDLGKLTLFSGIGMGQMIHWSPIVFKKYDFENWLYNRKTGLTTHNFYVTVLLEYGFLAFISLLIFIYFSLKNFWLEFNKIKDKSIFLQLNFTLFFIVLSIFIFHTSTTLPLAWIILSFVNKLSKYN